MPTEIIIAFRNSFVCEHQQKYHQTENKMRNKGNNDNPIRIGKAYLSYIRYISHHFYKKFLPIKNITQMIKLEVALKIKEFLITLFNNFLSFAPIEYPTTLQWKRHRHLE